RLAEIVDEVDIKPRRTRRVNDAEANHSSQAAGTLAKLILSAEDRSRPGTCARCGHHHRAALVGMELGNGDFRGEAVLAQPRNDDAEAARRRWSGGRFFEGATSRIAQRQAAR